MRRGLAPLLMCCALSGPAAAADIVVGVAAPLTGPSALLGEQIAEAAYVAAQAQSPGVVFTAVDDQCTAAGGANAARSLVASKVSIVVGFLCAESIEAALPILQAANVPVITVGVRTDSLTDRRFKTGWPVWRLGPRADGERNAVGEILTREWREQLFAIIDDGTIYGRELAESLRAAAEQVALVPVFIDTFRPQLDNQIGLAGRLRKAGATHVFAGGDFEDIAVLGRDAATLGMDLVIAGGESLRAEPGPVPLPAGTLMIAVQDWATVADPALVRQLQDEGVMIDGYALPAYAAVQVAAKAVADAEASSRPLADVLSDTLFETAIGPVDFDDKGDLAASPYRLFRFDGTAFVEVR
ncbi:MAG: ABC transporter substrate-binding protein [Rhizobiaceae bacterium]|nr:ABC transporter substrate-binding protein [Rhizobiaceae bacterium]